MTWQFLIILHTFMAAGMTLTLRGLARIPQAAKLPFAANGLLFLILYPIGLAFIPVLGNLQLDAWSNYWPFLVFGGLAFAATNICTFKLLSYLDSTAGSIVGTVNVLFTIILAGAVLHENLTPQQILGAAILIPTIWYVLWLSRSAKKTDNRWAMGLLFALLAGMAFAVSIVNEKYLLSKMPVSSYFLFGWGWQMFVAVGLALWLQPKGFKTLWQAKYQKWIIAAGIARALGGVTFVMAQVRSDNVSLMTVISNFRIVLIALFASWVLQERRFYLQKIGAAATAVLALTIIFWK